MDHQKRVSLFDRWAADYDRSVTMAGKFPFAGYDKVLSLIVSSASPEPGMRVLDIGIGTGNLAQRFVEAGCHVWGIDFSARMLEQARKRLPTVRMIQADLLRALPQNLPRFNRIVSAYVLHEFDLPVKVKLLARLVQQYLSPDGLLLVGDIAFPSIEERDRAHRLWKDAWDEDEYYWAFDEALPALSGAGLTAEYAQVSACAGILVIQPATPNPEGP